MEQRVAGTNDSLDNSLAETRGNPPGFPMLRDLYYERAGCCRSDLQIGLYFSKKPNRDISQIIISSV